MVFKLTKRQRLWKILREFAVIIILGFIYLAVFLDFDIGIPCWFNKLTGLKCPGCGMTHAIAQLWRGDIKEALEYNALCLSVLPITCLYVMYRAVRYVNSDEEGFHIWEHMLLAVLLAVSVGYSVVRNIT